MDGRESGINATGKVDQEMMARTDIWPPKNRIWKAPAEWSTEALGREEATARMSSPGFERFRRGSQPSRSRDTILPGTAKLVRSNAMARRLVKNGPGRTAGQVRGEQTNRPDGGENRDWATTGWRGALSISGM